VQGVRHCKPAATPIGFESTAAKDHPECAVCKTYLYFHAIECSCNAGRYCCAHHAHALCACKATSWTMHYRHSVRDLHTQIKVRLFFVFVFFMFLSCSLVRCVHDVFPANAVVAACALTAAAV
jgi:hypothetical protein